jgi:hypothetical protein
MGLAIDIDEVEAVLLADGWHDVVFFEGKSSFETDAYEFIQKGDEKSFDLRVGRGTVEGVPSMGAQWSELRKNQICKISCPLTAILAVRERGKKLAPGSADYCVFTGGIALFLPSFL